LLSTKKSLKGLIECILYFLVGGLISLAFMYLGLSEIQKTLSYFRYSKKWTGDILLVLGVASFIFAFVFAIVKYGL
jgi:ABC-type antimicrobial peptide transport system permease subunit